MSLLREIQDDAINSNVKVSDLLRKCKILAYRLGNEDFKNWVDLELNGYSSNNLLPDYRKLHVGSKGHFVGSFGSSFSNADMPTAGLPENLRKQCTTANFNSPIATLESYTTADPDGELTQSWNLAILAKYGSNMYSDLNCIQAWKVIPIASVIGMIDTVKTKILNFVLEIEALNPEAGEAKLNSNPIPQDQVSQVFNFNIAGNVQNIASGNHHSNIRQEVNNQLPEGFIRLIDELKQSDIDNEIASEATRRIEILGASIGTKEYKTLYGDFMSFASDHISVLSFMAPFIPMLSSYLS
ncbi:AbiTii domain-containing protein [Acinetobacter seifertii]|uniref:AbiTii domain-containing protein n=1 Tax=Acinetobacter seifertii TaxID=1530123 RepID=UPI00083A5F50|nr:hypothetical protein [Acinetobacter seifertii]MBJ9424273.1 hypothetical protein [Acinetobacter seifertii]OCZ56217.1 hypothetical protein A7P21_09280 [Acinetobacter seifertii]